MQIKQNDVIVIKLPTVHFGSLPLWYLKVLYVPDVCKLSMVTCLALANGMKVKATSVASR